MFDCLVIGAGICGGVIARRLAEEKNLKVLLVEKRSHIAGNLFDKKNEAGILVQEYGPHIFHTNRDDIYDFICRFSEWQPFKLRCAVVIDGKTTPSPFNFQTIDAFYPPEKAEKLKSELLSEYPKRDAVTIVEMLESKNPIVKEYADMLFAKDYSLYTAKQWGIPADRIDVSVLRRVPVRLDYKDMYFDEKYECLPSGGFTEFYKSLVSHPNIEIRTETDGIEYLNILKDKKCVEVKGCDSLIPVVYTGPIDALLNYRFSHLPYRSLRFDVQTIDCNDFQQAPVVAYPQAADYTRITEYTKLPVHDGHGKTTVAYEYPLPYRQQANAEPYYPIINEENLEAYQKYYREIEDIDNLFLCGRLADYKYYNMDQAVARAFTVYGEIADFIDNK